MNRNELQAISRVRLKEAAVLLRAGLYSGAYYLAGYAVECALKACIAKQTNKYDFPDKTLANKAWEHDLDKLLNLAGLGPKVEPDWKTNKALEVNWTLVKDWKVSARYEADISGEHAKAFYSACAGRKHGILAWIRKRW